MAEAELMSRMAQEHAMRVENQRLAMNQDVAPIYSYMVGGTEDSKGKSLETDPREQRNNDELAKQILRTPGGNDKTGDSPVYRFPHSSGGTDSYPVPSKKDIDEHKRRRR